MENQRYREGFSYTTEQANNIIVAESLLDEIAASREAGPDIEKAFSELTKITKKDIGLQLRITNLSDYWREKLIPRGLRIQKCPSFNTEDREFKIKWEAILHKCSLDLILLLIEHDKKEREAVQDKLGEIKSKISEIDDDKKKTLEDKLKQDIESHTETVKQDKIQIFKRNKDDLRQGKVYNWNRLTECERHFHEHPSIEQEEEEEEKVEIEEEEEKKKKVEIEEDVYVLDDSSVLITPLYKFPKGK